jgi:glycosyltransferase involved in cell wall biosynthesis
LETLRVAKTKKIPSLIEIPTWHRGSQKPDVSGQKSDVRKNWKSRTLLDRERFLEEYELASLVAVLSEKAAESFRAANFPDEKMFYLPRGVDVDRFKPASEPDGRKRPPIFRAIFSGALIERKGIHNLLEAWHRLNLRDAELWLLGSVHDEAKPHLEKFWRDSIRVLGFKRDLENYLNQGSVYVFPSRLEGSAKTIYEAAASGLPMITTREAGDVVRDGVEGIIVQPGDVDAIAAAIEHLYRHPEIVASMGAAARQRVVENFTWDHYRSRLLNAYERAIQLRSGGL